MMTFAPTEADRTARLRRYSASIAWLLTGVLILLPAAIAVYVFAFPTAVMGHPWVADLEAARSPLPFGWTLAAFAILLLGSGPRLFAIWAARRLFRDYAKGSLFSPAATVALRRMAYGILASAFVQPIGSTLLSTVLYAAGATDDVMVSLGTDQLWLVVLGLVILGIAHVMREAEAIAEDNAAIV
jgi:hypothetical protein